MPVIRPPAARWLAGAAAVLCAVAFGFVLYGRTPFAPKAESAICARSNALARTASPLEIGEMAAMNTPPSVAPMPELAFQGPDGKGRTLASFRGKTVLVNLWATWCVPCREEMPALDKLQAQAGSDGFEVVAINIDTTRLERPKAFLADTGVKTLAFYADPSADVFYRLKQAGLAVGLPTSFLAGPDGCGFGVLAGSAKWDSDDALAMVRSVAR